MDKWCLCSEATFAPSCGALAIRANPLADMTGRKLLTAHQTGALFSHRRLVWFRFLIITSGRHSFTPGKIILASL